MQLIQLEPTDSNINTYTYDLKEITQVSRVTDINVHIANVRDRFLTTTGTGIAGTYTFVQDGKEITIYGYDKESKSGIWIHGRKSLPEIEPKHLNPEIQSTTLEGNYFITEATVSEDPPREVYTNPFLGPRSEILIIATVQTYQRINKTDPATQEQTQLKLENLISDYQRSGIRVIYSPYNSRYLNGYC